MRGVYPVILSKDGDDYLVYIPDFDMDTEGKSLEDAIFMARDAIGLMGIQYEDEGKQIPEASDAQKFYREKKENDIITLVDVDFAEYRRKHDKRMVKKNCTIPFYLCKEAEKRGISFSGLLQDALRNVLRENRN